MSLTTSDITAWITAGWGTGSPWPAQPAWQPGSALLLGTDPDRLVAIGLRPGLGLVSDGAILDMSVEMLIRGDQFDPTDSEQLAWALWAVLVDPGPDLATSRRLIGTGLQLRQITATSSPTFVGVDGVGAAQRPLHSLTVRLGVATA